MLLKELNSLFYIEQEIQIYENKIAELRARAESSTANYSGMPRGGGLPSSKVENGALDIVPYIEMLEKAKAERDHESKKIHEFILSVPDPQTRVIMVLRFIERKSWGDIARRIGGNNTPSAVRMRAIRYIDSYKA